MKKALAMVEYKTVSSGMRAADIMVKTAEVDIIEATTVCPGKYIVIFTGELSAVKASVEAVQTNLGEHLTDHFVLGNPHESIFPAIFGANPIDNPKALGVLETFSAPSIIVAADAAAKTSLVDLIELRIARGMCGKSFMFITGEIAAVSAAIERAQEEVSKSGWFLDSSIIPNPDPKLWESII